MKKDYLNYFLVIGVGVVLAVGVFTKIIFHFDIDSDWFWFLAGCGLVAEAMIAYRKQKKFDKKYKIVER